MGSKIIESEGGEFDYLDNEALLNDVASLLVEMDEKMVAEIFLGEESIESKNREQLVLEEVINLFNNFPNNLINTLTILESRVILLQDEALLKELRAVRSKLQERFEDTENAAYYETKKVTDKVEKTVRDITEFVEKNQEETELSQ